MTNSSTDRDRFSLIPEQVLYANISDGAYRLYGALARIVDTQSWQGYALISTMARRLNRSESAVKRNLRELVKAKLIRAQKQWTNGESYVTSPRDGWRQTSNLYTLHLNRGFKSDPRVNPEPQSGIKTDPGVGAKNDLQYQNHYIPDPYDPDSPPPF